MQLFLSLCIGLAISTTALVDAMGPNPGCSFGLPRHVEGQVRIWTNSDLRLHNRKASFLVPPVRQGYSDMDDVDYYNVQIDYHRQVAEYRPRIGQESNATMPLYIQDFESHVIYELGENHTCVYYEVSSAADPPTMLPEDVTCERMRGRFQCEGEEMFEGDDVPLYTMRRKNCRPFDALSRTPTMADPRIFVYFELMDISRIPRADVTFIELPDISMCTLRILDFQ